MRPDGAGATLWPVIGMDEPSTAERYRRFARLEARGNSPVYEQLTSAIAEDSRLIAMLDQLEPEKRQPNLLLAAVRYHDGPVDDPDLCRSWLVRHWEAVSTTMLARRTQTNEVGRCATLLPVLARIAAETGPDVPLSLIEVGASAGLCLYPDRLRYRYDGGEPIGDQASPVRLDCDTGGQITAPTSVPAVRWRAGIDLNPVDVADPEQVRWLECLIWPGRSERVRRLRGAIELARADPPELIAGDLVEQLSWLVSRAPTGSVPVVFHSAVLAYLPSERRQRFVRVVRELPVRWISNEGRAVLDEVAERLPSGTGRTRADDGGFVLALDGQPIAFTAPHGQWIRPMHSP